jgi:hypothetical protein
LGNVVSEVSSAADCEAGDLPTPPAVSLAPGVVAVDQIDSGSTARQEQLALGLVVFLLSVSVVGSWGKRS